MVKAMQDKFGDDFDSSSGFGYLSKSSPNLSGFGYLSKSSSKPSSIAHLALDGMTPKSWSQQRTLFEPNGKRNTNGYPRLGKLLCTDIRTWTFVLEIRLPNGNSSRTGYDSPPKENTIQVEGNVPNEETDGLSERFLGPTSHPPSRGGGSGCIIQFG
ncbi:hypothetical protein AMTRI_Chr01g109220 [Amborella trichopoda]